MKKVAKRVAPVAAATVATATAVNAARKSPAARSVISRVVEQVRDTASNLGETVGNMMPGRSSSTTGSTGMGGGSSSTTSGMGGGHSDTGDEF